VSNGERKPGHMIRSLRFLSLSAVFLWLAQPASGGDLSVSQLPKLGDRASTVQSKLSDARVPGSVNEMYFVSLAGHRTVLRPYYYKDHGVARLAAVDIGYMDHEIPFAAFHAFMEFYLPDDQKKISPASYSDREKLEAEAGDRETDQVFRAPSHARAMNATKPCQAGVVTVGLP
jgi:hypothetical protein